MASRSPKGWHALQSRKDAFDLAAFEKMAQLTQETLHKHVKELPYKVVAKPRRHWSVSEYNIDGVVVTVKIEKWGWGGHAQVYLGWHKRTSPFQLRSKTAEGFDYAKIMEGIKGVVEGHKAHQQYMLDKYDVRQKVLENLERHSVGDQGRIFCYDSDNNITSDGSYQVGQDGTMTVNITLAPKDYMFLVRITKLFPEHEV